MRAAWLAGSPAIDGGFRQAARGFGIIIMTCRARFFWRTCRRLILISTAEAKAKAGSVQLVSTAPFLQPSNTPRGGILPGRVTSRSGIDRFPIGAANTCFKFVLFLDRRNPTPRARTAKNLNFLLLHSSREGQTVTASPESPPYHITSILHRVLYC